MRKRPHPTPGSPAPRLLATLVIAALGLFAAPPALAQPDNGPRAGIAGELPPQHSTIAAPIDRVMNFINLVSFIFFVVIIVLMVYFAIRYRRCTPQQRAESQTSHSTAVELTWSIAPLFIVMAMFWFGMDFYLAADTPPPNAYTVNVQAKKWSWTFTHPNGVQSDILEVPAGEPVRLLMASEDVIHSLFIPGFRVKKDVVPGRFAQLWFEALAPTPFVDEQLPEGATKEQKDELAGKVEMAGHWLFCTEFCGTQHSTMISRVVVHPEGWRPKGIEFGPDPTVEEGEYLFRIKGCNTCHQVVSGGPKLAGPDFYTGIFGKQEQLTSGQSVLVDDAYIIESIRNPPVKVVVNHQPVMAPFTPAMLSDKQINSLILYIKTFGDATNP